MIRLEEMEFTKLRGNLIYTVSVGVEVGIFTDADVWTLGKGKMVAQPPKYFSHIKQLIM